MKNNRHNRKKIIREYDISRMFNREFQDNGKKFKFEGPPKFSHKIAAGIIKGKNLLTKGGGVSLKNWVRLHGTQVKLGGILDENTNIP